MISRAKVREMSDGELRFAAQDLAEAIEAQTAMWREGLDPRNLGRYSDELHVVAREIHRRRSAGAWGGVCPKCGRGLKRDSWGHWRACLDCLRVVEVPA